MFRCSLLPFFPPSPPIRWIVSVERINRLSYEVNSVGEFPLKAFANTVDRCSTFPSLQGRLKLEASARFSLELFLKTSLVSFFEDFN